jgi:hypothetical protein
MYFVNEVITDGVSSVDSNILQDHLMTTQLL